MSSIDTSPIYQGALPQGSREDASQLFYSTSNVADHGSSGYPNFLGNVNDLGVNGMQAGNASTTFNATQQFQSIPQYDQYGSQQQPHIQQQEAFNAMSSHPSIARSLSPSTMNDHFSPDGFLSDPNMNDISNYSTPGMDDGFIQGSFTPMLNLRDGPLAGPSPFNSLAGANDQISEVHGRYPTSSSYPTPSLLTHSHLPSPQSTHRSSPVVQQGINRPQTDVSVLPMANPETTFTASAYHLPNPVSRQQPSPALTGSSLGVPSSNVSAQPQLVVTVDEADHAGTTRTSSKRSHASKKSNTHLSPYPDADFSEDEIESEGPVQRDLDGSWLKNKTSGQSGVQPGLRRALNEGDMPTLEEMEQQRHRSERIAEVEEWLTHSDIGSEAESIEGTARKPRQKKSKNRPRAKSTNDASPGDPFNAGLGVSTPLINISSIPGPGVYINEPSDMGDNDGSDSEGGPESPPAEIEHFNEVEGFFPSSGDVGSLQGQPWEEPNQTPNTTTNPATVQGITANLAIFRFRQRAKETDNASLTATVGSRRRSESDIGSVVAAAGISKLLLSPPDKTERKGVRRRGSFLENILPHRNNSSKLKRKNSQASPQPDAVESAQSPKEPQPVKRIGSFGRPKTPRVDTNFSSASAEARSPSTVAAAASGAIAHAKQIWRSRSRSDLGKSPKMGLADLWTQAGGPPMPTLASPSNSRPAQSFGARDADDESGDEEAAEQDGITMDLSVRTDMQVIPTYDGFKFQARQLNPRLADFLLERITQEQVKRYKRLVDFKIKHNQSVAAHTCTSKLFCFASGGEGKVLPPRAGNKDPDTTLVGFQILGPGMTEDDLEMTAEGQTVAAQFPSGVPIPPVKRLPAEFECPLCFKVKKFYKPSDWTKHVHEDVQPFTCTFHGCNEPKSFKRKADWVRHENERHRQLEYWTCNIGECTHTCYRKDNFVQHLVREHKVPEPKVRTGRSIGSRSPITPVDPMNTWGSTLGVPQLGDAGIDDVWGLVDKCHKDSSKQPKDEPCKFCGNICTSWKKLTVHLAKHMEQISMPVLALVEQRRTAPDMATSGMGQQQAQPLSILSVKRIDELPTFLCDEPMEMDMDTLGRDVNAISPNLMHSYPPANVVYQTQMTAPATNFSSSPTSFAGSSYPPPSVPSRSRAASFNDAQHLTMSRQGTTYPPAVLPTRNIQSATPNAQYDGQQMFFTTGPVFADGMANSTNGTYLTPNSGTPASLGYSPEGSVQDLQQTYQFQ